MRTYNVFDLLKFWQLTQKHPAQPFDELLALYLEQNPEAVDTSKPPDYVHLREREPIQDQTLRDKIKNSDV